VPQLSKLLPGSGLVVSEVKEQNALMLRGSPAEIAEAVAILENLDRPAMQVTISCVIVELKRGRNFEIGLHSGSTRKTGENDLGVRGFWDFMGKDVSASGAFGKIGILPARFEMELSAMEENNRAEVLARPRLTTLNGNKAELNVTNTVYYLVSQVSADGYPITDYRSFNDGISLEITPTVTQGGSITLNISPEIKTAGRSSGDGPRDISTRNLKTTVTLKNGETLCLGGLVRKGKSEVRTAVPFLGSIPLIGRLFSYVSEVEDESELAIFITPEVEF
jgi:type IV pilus assembly protein PilQ